jgi:lipopolysaccharide biosynthesis regulator YciM
LKRALRKAPGLGPAWIALGELEAERGRTRAALAAWAKAAQIDRSTGPLVYPRLAATYAALDRAREFEAWLTRLIAERPDDAAARVALAGALAARGEMESALAELRRCLEQDPADLPARAALGRLLLAEGRDAEAAKACAELLDVLERSGALRRSEDLS